MLEALFWVFFGIMLGSVAGLLPGIHPNTLIPPALLLLSFLDPIVLALTILSMGISNIFFSSIPTLLFRSAEETTALAVSPAESMQKEGRGYEALMSFSIGHLGGVVLAILLIPVFYLIMSTAYAGMKAFIPAVLISVAIYGISREKKGSMIYALFALLLSSLLGLASLSFSDSFIFPLLSGLFGIPALIEMARSKSTIRYLEDANPSEVDLREIRYPVVSGAVAGGFAGLLPGVGASQIALIVMESAKLKGGGKTFLSTLGAINASDLVYSVLAISIIGNPRSGIAVAISNLVKVDLFMLMTFLGILLFVSVVSFFLTLKMGKSMVNMISKLDQRIVSACVMAFIVFLVIYLTGAFGLAVLLLSAAVGYIPIRFDTGRTHLMGCLIAPTALWFLGIRTI
ncbi:MAG TPA: tripartite tricarboxylate transporter permease [archaeon]|nr:tripartite tricarboxylate transporter permease [archaeon]